MTDQFDLWGSLQTHSVPRHVIGPAARDSDPATSHAAADAVCGLRQVHHDLIVECLRAHGALSKDGVAARTRLTGVAVARRLPELHRLGRIRPTGRTVPSTAGRAEREWEVVR